MENIIVYLSNLSDTVFTGLSNFVYFYPFFMAYVWMFGAVYYFIKWERKSLKQEKAPVLKEYPLVSIVIPCYNEAEHIDTVIEQLDKTTYPNFEIIAVNDGSKDNTADVLISLMQKYPRLRVLDFVVNQGKATGLNMAAIAAKGEYLVCIDGDAFMDPDAVTWLVSHFQKSPRVGAITGKPKIRNRSTILGKLQVGEFSAIVGMIKRAQSIYGKIFAVSGVVTAFRKEALHDVGYWSTDMITEDIDICWRLQIRHWSINFEPHAMCWILMPETLSGLWKQRVRWAQGGAEVLFKYPHIFEDKRQRRMWPVYIEYLLSISWAFSFLFVLILYALGLITASPINLVDSTVYGILLGVTFMLQFLISFYISSRYEKGMGKFYYWLVWYPIAYWMIIAGTSIAGFFKAINRDTSKRAVWDSPDRGI